MRRSIFLLLLSVFLVGGISLSVPTPVEAQQLQPTLPQSGDSHIDGLIRDILRAVHDIATGVSGAYNRLCRLLRELFVTLGAYLRAIDVQIRASQCHDRSCGSYGINGGA